MLFFFFYKKMKKRHPCADWSLSNWPSHSPKEILKSRLINVLKTGSVTEPEKLLVHGSLIGLTVELWLNR